MDGAHAALRADGTTVPQLEPDRYLAAEQVAHERRERSSRALGRRGRALTGCKASGLGWSAPPGRGIDNLSVIIAYLPRSFDMPPVSDTHGPHLPSPISPLAGELLPRLPAPTILASDRGSWADDIAATQLVRDSRVFNGSREACSRFWPAAQVSTTPGSASRSRPRRRMVATRSETRFSGDERRQHSARGSVYSFENSVTGFEAILQTATWASMYV